MIYINILLLNCTSHALTFRSTELVKSFICYNYMCLHVLHARSYALVTLFDNRYIDYKSKFLHKFLFLPCNHNVIVVIQS